ncbi:hypothetical protein [Kribbella sp. HUAS MG21]|uniref:Uncharacterized protein n=1 Tax=Kribbella sp. HUAS MG21 TaxID=3160966 RepID=A0AAU7TJA3_9ACTN
MRRSGAVRRTVAGAALAITAVATSLTAAPAAAAEPEVWVGPFFTRWSCEVTLASVVVDGRVCHFNPSPPTTTLGWYYKLP